MNSNFELQIQSWVALDNQLKLMNEKIHELREKKHDLCDKITNYAQTNNLTSTTIQISDGKLKFANTKVAAPLTFKYLEKSLGEVIKNESQVKQIVDYLKQHRDIKVVPEIKRVSNN